MKPRTEKQKRAYRRLSRMMRWVYAQADVRAACRVSLNGRRNHSLASILTRRIKEWKETNG